jgi:hydroxypyruvate reductase
MAEAAVDILGDRLVAGLIIADHHRSSPHPLVRVMVGDHPYPGRSSLAAGRAALDLVGQGSRDELLLVLVSGGGSSLMEVPAPGITFEDLHKVGQALVTGGVPITQMNVVRRHLSAVKNGGVVKAARAQQVASLLISDVVDGPPSAIASGPTLADQTNADDAIRVLADFRLHHKVPESVVGFLSRSPSSLPGSGQHPFQVIADGLGAATAAGRRLEEQGLATRLRTVPVVGAAAEATRRVVERSRPGLVDVCWGETTVKIEGSSPGRGGRNQHAALVAAGHLTKRGRGIFGAFATDGADGASDAAGGLVDSGTVSRGWSAGLDWRAHLHAFDSSPYLEACGDLIKTGPTGANVGDLWLVTG